MNVVGSRKPASAKVGMQSILRTNLEMIPGANKLPHSTNTQPALGDRSNKNKSLLQNTEEHKNITKESPILTKPNTLFSCPNCNEQFTVFSDFRKHFHIHSLPLQERKFEGKGSNKVFGRNRQLASITEPSTTVSTKVVVLRSILRKELPVVSNDNELPHCSEKQQIQIKMEPLLGESLNKNKSVERRSIQHVEVSDEAQITTLNEDSCRVIIGPKTLFSCPECNKTFTVFRLLQRHFRTHCHSLPGRKFNCKLCNQVFDAPNQLRNHRLSHKTDRPFKCNLCEKSFKTKQSLTNHTTIHTGEKRYRCDSCSYATLNKTILQYHKNSQHNRVIDFMCKICGKKFGSPSSLKHHIPTHGERKFKCKDCDKTFHHKGHLTDHQESHNPNRNRFHCEVCGANYSYMSGLKNHILLSHTDVTKYDCDFCGKKLTSGSSLRIHRRIHTGEKPFTCNICNKSFISRNYLATHKRVHSGEKPYKCQECSKSFSQRGTLTIHVRSHTGLKPFVCKLCPCAFVTQTLLTAHGKSHK